MEFSDFLTALNLMLSDTNNFALSVDQKTQNLTTAFQDQYAIAEVWDGSLVYSVSDYQYLLPTDVDVVWDIYTERDPTLPTNPEPIDTRLWEQIAGNIQFTRDSQWKIPDQQTIWIHGGHKVTVSDNITDEAVQNYLLSLAGWISLRNIGYTRLLSFLRNDSTVADIINLRKEMLADMQMYRDQLQTRFISA